MAGTLSFAERVAYQYAIEEVYWRHRIWPKENPGPKPPLDAMISRDQIERKVNKYLHQSRVLTEERRAITPEQLETEIERMVRDTKQPEVLRELFTALGDDHFIIAECLARPALSERVGERSPHDNGGPLATANISASHMYKLPVISGVLGSANDTWTATTQANAPDARSGHIGVWTGSEMIVWGGENFSPGPLSSGYRYFPSTDSWIATSMTNAPAGRAGHTAVWTGNEMIIWGGGGPSGFLFNTGGRYNPASDSWTAAGVANAPVGRVNHTAVWTGSEMIAWGGQGNNVHFNSGGRYNPGTDSWTATSLLSAPSPRWEHAAVWTGSEMIVWGGTDAAINSTYLHTGGRYNPATNTWRPTSLVNVPLGRIAFTWIWTQSEMIVWGGVDESFNDTNTGDKYDPETDRWVATEVANGAPLPRDSHVAAWTGREMIVWGGSNYPAGDLNDGKRYDPGTDSWTPMTTVNAPFARAEPTAVWTGTQMIVWGGISYNAGIYLDNGGSYSAQPSAPSVRSVVSQKAHGSAGSFDVDLPQSGTPGTECRGGGAMGDYTIVVTFLANVAVSGSPQAAVTSGIGTIGSGGAANGGAVVTSGNVVTIPLTNVANAQTIQITLNSVNGSGNVTIPMRVLIGDVNGNGAVNATDVAMIKARSGQTGDATNFRADLNTDGSINAADISLVKANSGVVLP